MHTQDMFIFASPAAYSTNKNVVFVGNIVPVNSHKASQTSSRSIYSFSERKSSLQAASEHTCIKWVSDLLPSWDPISQACSAVDQQIPLSMSQAYSDWKVSGIDGESNKLELNILQEWHMRGELKEAFKIMEFLFLVNTIFRIYQKI